MILVLSKDKAKDFEWDEPWACISIDTFDGDHPEIHEDNRVGLLRVSFGDVLDTTNPEWFEKYGEPITDETAQEIWEFVDKYWNEIDLLMIHCQAGASRSPAVAAAIAKRYEGSDSKYFRVGSGFSPNKTVYERMNKNSPTEGCGSGSTKPGRSVRL